jgi:hypothetical protein
MTENNMRYDKEGLVDEINRAVRKAVDAHNKRVCQRLDDIMDRMRSYELYENNDRTNRMMRDLITKVLVLENSLSGATSTDSEASEASVLDCAASFATGEETSHE